MGEDGRWPGVWRLRECAGIASPAPPPRTPPVDAGDGWGRWAARRLVDGLLAAVGPVAAGWPGFPPEVGVWQRLDVLTGAPRGVSEVLATRREVPPPQWLGVLLALAGVDRPGLERALGPAGLVETVAGCGLPAVDRDWAHRVETGQVSAGEVWVRQVARAAGWHPGRVERQAVASLVAWCPGGTAASGLARSRQALAGAGETLVVSRRLLSPALGLPPDWLLADPRASVDGLLGLLPAGDPAELWVPATGLLPPAEWGLGLLDLRCVPPASEGPPGALGAPAVAAADRVPVGVVLPAGGRAVACRGRVAVAVFTAVGVVDAAVAAADRMLAAQQGQAAVGGVWPSAGLAGEHARAPG